MLKLTKAPTSIQVYFGECKETMTFKRGKKGGKAVKIELELSVLKLQNQDAHIQHWRFIHNYKNASLLLKGGKSHIFWPSSTVSLTRNAMKISNTTEML